MSESADAVTSSVLGDNPKSQNSSEVGILVGEAEHLQSLGPESCFWELDDGRHKRETCRAAASGHWSEASSYFEINPDWLRIPLSARGITALHVAVSMEQTSFVKKLVDCMNMQDMEISMEDRNTAFCLAAISGNVKIAEILFDKNPRLLWIKGQNNMLPIQLASSAGHIPMTEFLFHKTGEDLNNISFQDIVKLFLLTISNNIYTVTSKLLNRWPQLVTTENERGLTPLEMLAQFSSSKGSIGHRDIIRSLFKGMEEHKESLKSVQLSKAMFDAAKSGNILILEFLLKYHPDLLFEVDSAEKRSLLHIAILYRQETVYQLILSKGAFKNVMVQLVDFEGNNVLHLAAKLEAPEKIFGLSTNHVVMRGEERWFQEVEKIVPAGMRRMRNNDGLTPEELFYCSHKELHQKSLSGLKVTANALIVVATLIITLGITGAMTIPIKDIDSTDTPIFRKKTWYTFFFLSIAFGICLCAASMIFYASAILPSSWEPKNESVHLRQTKLVLGNGALFSSLAVMFTAIISGAILIFEFLSNWLLYFILGLGIIVFVMYLTLEYHRWSSGVRSVLIHSQVAKRVRLIVMANSQHL